MKPGDEQSEETFKTYLEMVNHKKHLTFSEDPELNYFLVTYVCNYRKDPNKAYNALQKSLLKLYKCSHLSIGYELNSRGYLHVHAVVGFKQTPLFNSMKSKGTTLNYKRIQKGKEHIERAIRYIHKDHEEYGYSKQSLLIEYALKNLYCIADEDEEQ